MLMVIVGGVVLTGLFLPFGQLRLAAKAFILIWFIVSVANIWVGVSKAGYSVAQELPILPIVFVASSAVAAIAIRQFARS